MNDLMFSLLVPPPRQSGNTSIACCCEMSRDDKCVQADKAEAKECLALRTFGPGFEN